MRASLKRHAGFSLTELVVALLVALILMAVGLPAFLRAYHSYQLSSAANQFADILRLSRYEAKLVDDRPSEFPYSNSKFVERDEIKSRSTMFAGAFLICGCTRIGVASENNA